MKRVFSVNNEGSQYVVFTFETDEDGDFQFLANGVKVFYIDSTTGVLQRYFVDDVQGEVANLSFVDNVLEVYGTEEDI